MGSIAFLMDILVEELVQLRWISTEIIAKSHPSLGWFVLIVFSILFVLIASALSVFVAPSAIGSGVAEAIGILNGVAYADYICPKALFVKFFGVCFAVAGGLCGGKEGPLVHIGSIVGYASAYLPLGFTKYFRNDFEKRKLMAVGTAAGVSAAFGAPIGGSLFAYEISKPNTFWSFSLTWKVFFASTISTFCLSLFKQLYDNNYPIYVSNSEIIKLGVAQKSPTMDSLLGSIVLGFVGGLLGAAFILINNKVNSYRKRFLKTKWLKIFEAIFIVTLTVTTMYLTAYIKYNSHPNADNDIYICQGDIVGIPTRQFLCK